MTRTRVSTLFASALMLALVFCNYALANNTFCAKRTLNDYAKVVRELQAHLPKFPSDSHPDFAPNATLMVSDADQVLLSEEGFGYQLALGKGTSRPVHWQIITSIEEIRPTKQLIARHRRLVNGGKGTTISFTRKVGPGIYRLAMRILDRRGRSLGTYFAIFNILPRRLGVRVSTNGSHFAAGSTVLGRVENYGTVDALLPESSALTVERWNASSWDVVLIGHPNAIPVVDPEFLPRGKASECTYFKVAAGIAPGKYRFSVLFEPLGAKRRARRATKPFVVEGP